MNNNTSQIIIKSRKMGKSFINICKFVAFIILSFVSFSTPAQIVFHWSLSDSKSKYPCRFLICDLDCFNSSSNFQFIQYVFQVLGDCSKCSNYDWYHCHLQIFSSLVNSMYLSCLPLLSNLRKRWNLLDDKFPLLN